MHGSKTFPIITVMLRSMTCRFVGRNIHKNGEETVNSAKLHDNLSTNYCAFCR